MNKTDYNVINTYEHVLMDFFHLMIVIKEKQFCHAVIETHSSLKKHSMYSSSYSGFIVHLKEKKTYFWIERMWQLSYIKLLEFGANGQLKSPSRVSSLCYINKPILPSFILKH